MGKEVEKCRNHCAPEKHTCSWGDWTVWNSCSNTCGTKGRRTRNRHLVLGSHPARTIMHPPIEQLYGHYVSQAMAQTNATTFRKSYRLVAAFISGCFVFMVVFGAGHL